MPFRYAIIVGVWCTAILCGCASDPSTSTSAYRRSGDTRPPTPQEMSQLRAGMSIADCQSLIGARHPRLMRSRVTGVSLEVWQVVPDQTYSTYLVLFVGDKFDAVVPEHRLANDGMLAMLFGVFMLGDQFIWMPAPETPPVPPLPHAGGDADVVARLRGNAEPLAGIDFATVDHARKDAENQLRGWRFASGFINPLLWLAEDTSVACRKQFLKRLERVKLGASREQALAALGEPLWSQSVGDVQYLLFEIDHTCPISIAMRRGTVEGVYAWDLQQAATVTMTGSKPAQTASSPAAPLPVLSSPAPVDRPMASPGRGR
jgi:hypothetical protein